MCMPPSPPSPPTRLVGAGQHLGGGMRCDGWPPGPAPGQSILDLCQTAQVVEIDSRELSPRACCPPSLWRTGDYGWGDAGPSPPKSARSAIPRRTMWCRCASQHREPQRVTRGAFGRLGSPQPPKLKRATDLRTGSTGRFTGDQPFGWYLGHPPRCRSY
jgi:hypothetical protein